MIRFGITSFRDRRTVQLLAAGNRIEQEFADQALEREWRRRVQANIKIREQLKNTTTEKNSP